MTVWFSLSLTVFAYTLLSCGYVLQKKGVSWIGYKGTKDRAFYRNLATWAAGFLLMNLYIIPNAAALKRLDPHIVSAMAGWGVIVLVFLSQALLKERMFRSDLAYTALVVAAIALLNIFERPETGEDVIRIRPLIAALAVPFVLVLPGLIPALSRRVRGLIFACVSGLSAGLIIVTMSHPPTFTCTWSSPWPPSSRFRHPTRWDACWPWARSSTRRPSSIRCSARPRSSATACMVSRWCL
jgi:multidrug transporter EmrE-like cation transporter